MNQSKPNETSLATDILLFYDEFVEFHDYCAFLCDAFAYFASDDQVDVNTAMGVSRFSHYIKHRALKLKQELKLIQERSYTDENSSNP